MKPMSKLLALLLATLGGHAVADPVTVEVILFRYEAAAEAAQWPAAEGLPSFTGARPLEESAPAGGEAWYVALSPSALRLAGASAALRRAGGREVLLHTAWRQPSGEGATVYLKAPVADPATAPALEGSLSIREAGRDLRLNGDFFVALGEGKVEVRADQKFKSGELRYVDHALLGLLVQVTPDQEAPAAGQEDAAAPTPAPTGGQQGPAD